ncbi:MAG: CHAT domain-containing tetratricopeptide repeat protein [Bacteroidota bacterium]
MRIKIAIVCWGLMWLGCQMLVGQVDTSAAHRCFNRGYALLKNGQFQNDSTYFYLDRAKVLFAEAGFPCRAFEVELFHIYGDRSRKGHVDWRRAKSRYLPLIKEIEKIPCSSDKLLGEVYFRMGRTYLLLNNRDSSEYFATQSLPKLQASWPDGHWKIAIIYSDLGAISLSRENFTKAYKLYQDALNHYEKLDSLFPSYVARVLNNLASVTIHLGMFEEALAFRMRTLSLLIDQHGEISPEVAACYNDIGNLYDKIQQYEESMCYYELALTLMLRSSISNHSALASIYLNIGSIHALGGNFEVAEEHFRKSLKSNPLRLRRDTLKYITTNIFLAESLANLFRFEESIGLLLSQANLLEEKGMGTTRLMADCEIYLGKIYRIAGQHLTALQHFQQGLELKQILEKNPQSVFPLANFSVVLFGLGQSSEAIETLLLAEKQILSQSLPKPYHLQSIYDDLGSNYQMLGNYPASLTYHTQALRIIQKYYPSNEWLISGILMDIGGAFQELGQQDSALFYLNQALTFIDESRSEFRYIQAHILNTKGAVYMTLQQWTMAQQHIQKALNLYEEILPTTHPKILETVLRLTKTFIAKEQFPQAIRYLSHAQEIIENLESPNPNHQVVLYLNLAELEQKMGNFRSALLACQSGLQAASLSFYSQNIASNPSVDSLLLVPSVIELLKRKGQILAEDPRFLSEAFRTTELVIQMIHQLSIGFNSDSRLHLKKIHTSVFESGLKIGFQRKRRAPIYGDELILFQLLEQSKAGQLRMDLREKVARQKSGIPDSLTLLLHELLFQIHQMESQLAGGKQRDNFRENRSHLFDLKRRHDSLIAHFEQAYPLYYEMKYNQELASLSTIQQNLQDNHALLEYFVGDSNLYGILIRTDTVMMKQLPPVQLDWIDSLHQAIQWGYPKMHEFIDSVAFAPYAYGLYRALIQPFADDLPERLIIVPDGPLAYIPFEILLTEPISKSFHKNEGSYPYLIRKKNISYALSATLWMETLRAKPPLAEESFLGIAPFDEKGWNPIDWSLKGDFLQAMLLRSVSGSEQLQPLPSSKEEVKQIQKIMGGEIWIDQEARKIDWIKEAPKFQFIHLATHGKVFDQHPDLNRIYFAETSDSTDQEFLTLADLYGIHLNAEMAVLSACETGMGKLLPGEGIASLARGFTYAGARSVVSTLWKVDDPTTKELMIAFYKNLDAGMDKASALREAKLTVLDDTFKPPFYWAAPIAMGDMRPIPSRNEWTGWWIVGLLLILVGLFVVGRQVMLSSKTNR